jgi:hypothetical protein
LIERGSRADEISDATVGIYLAQLRDFEPLLELPESRRIVADTKQDLAPIVVEVERHIASQR